jgi:DNA-binding transcriptional ArsR family regulator
MNVLAITRVGAALGDATRVAIFRLSNGTYAIADIAPIVGVSPSAVSYHLKRLREAGLVSTTRRGRWRVPKRTSLASRVIEWAGAATAPAHP